MRIAFVSGLLILAIAVIALADDPVETYFENANAQKQAAINAFEETLARVDSLKAEARKEIRTNNQAALKQLKESKRFLPEIESKVGSVGFLRASIKLRQRISETAALVEVSTFKSWSARIHLAVSFYGLKPELMIMRGMDFSDFVDGKSMVTDQILHITGTTTYNTALGGTNAVYVIEPLDAETKKGIEDRYATKEEAELAAIAAAEKARRERRTNNKLSVCTRRDSLGVELRRLAADWIPLMRKHRRLVSTGHILRAAKRRLQLGEARI